MLSGNIITNGSPYRSISNDSINIINIEISPFIYVLHPSSLWPSSLSFSIHESFKNILDGVVTSTKMAIPFQLSNFDLSRNRFQLSQAS